LAFIDLIINYEDDFADADETVSVGFINTLNGARPEDIFSWSFRFPKQVSCWPEIKLKQGLFSATGG
jgi:hypothetical protein